MAAQTGSTYISGTMIDGVEIPTVKLGFSTMTSSNRVSTTECDNDRQPETMLLLLALVTVFSTDDSTL